MDAGPRALGASTAALRKSKYNVLRRKVAHIPTCKDGTTPTMLADEPAQSALQAQIARRRRKARRRRPAGAARGSAPRERFQCPRLTLAVSCLVCQCLNTCCGLGFRVTIYINRSAVIDLRRMRRPSEAVVSVTSV